MKNYISIIAASLMIVSCVDTVIIPDDKTVDEDFWKSKSDVQLMVNGAYQAMLSENVLSKLIVWGGLRSDEMIPIDNLTSDVRDDLRDINLANIQADNMYAEWGPIYGIINRCNVVLEKLLP
jgi:PBP1b-binding outer membrane lipoprotein LpoB